MGTKRIGYVIDNSLEDVQFDRQCEGKSGLFAANLTKCMVGLEIGVV